MKIIVECTQCHKKLSLDDSQIGQHARCPNCKQVFKIQPPAEDDFLGIPASNRAPTKTVMDAIEVTDDRVEIGCKCGTTLRAAGANRGKAVRCPKCQAANPVPKLPIGHWIPDEPVANAASIWDDIPPATYQPVPSNASQNYDSPMEFPSSFPTSGAYSGVLGAKSRTGFSFWRALVTGNDQYTGVCFILLVFAPFFVRGGYQSNQLHEDLQRIGIVVPGEIQSGYEKTRRGISVYSFKVTYRSESGEAFTKNYEVNSEFFNERIDGEYISDGAVQVKHLPSDPGSSILVGGSVNAGYMIPFGIAGFFLGLAGLIYRVIYHWKES